MILTFILSLTDWPASLQEALLTQTESVADARKY